MRVHELHRKNANFANLGLPVSALYLLAAPSTPDKAIDVRGSLARARGCR
jgi:hypothetical protein